MLYFTCENADCQKFHLPDLDLLYYRPLAALVVLHGASDGVRTCLRKRVLYGGHRPFGLFVAEEIVTNL